MRIVCDTHVHCYHFEQLPDLLDAATLNLTQQGESDTMLLFFTDGVKDPTWERLLHRLNSGNRQAGEWRLNHYDEGNLIRADKNGSTIFLAPAKQINSAQRIEFLLLGCSENIEDGITEESIVEQFSDRYAVICPWGVGKWLGSRGKIMSSLIAKHADRLLLGDNGGRPKLWSMVGQFTLHPSLALNGSDPLPMSGEINRVGKFGVRFSVDDEQLTLEAVLQGVKAAKHHNFGTAMGIVEFFRLQIGLRLSS